MSELRTGTTCGIVLLAVMLVVSSTPAAAQTADQQPKPRSITVVGIGRERAAPDTAQLQFAVETTGPSAKAATEAAAASAVKVIDVLKKGVGAGGRVETVAYNLTPIYRQQRPPAQPDPERESREAPQIIGYTAMHSVAVETHEIKQVGTLIDSAIAAGAARVDSLAFTIENAAPIEARALRAAGEDAAEQAAAIAASLKVAVKHVLEAATEGVARPLPYKYGGMAMRAEMLQADTQIAPGDVTTEARLRVTYAIE